MLVSRIRVRMTSSRLAPSCSSEARTISMQRRICAAASPCPTVFPSGPMGAVPETAMMLPTRTARENPSFDSYGEPLDTRRCAMCPYTPSLLFMLFVMLMLLHLIIGRNQKGEQVIDITSFLITRSQLRHY